MISKKVAVTIGAAATSHCIQEKLTVKLTLRHLGNERFEWLV